VGIEQTTASRPVEGMVIRAIQDGDRIKAYEPIVEWVAAGRNPELMLRQLADTIIYFLHEQAADGSLAAADSIRSITDSAISSERAVCRPTH
jgi:hypothetical protein